MELKQFIEPGWKKLIDKNKLQRLIDKNKLQNKIDILERVGKNSYQYQYRAGYLRAIKHINCILNEPDSIIAQLDGDINVSIIAQLDGDLPVAAEGTKPELMYMVSFKPLEKPTRTIICKYYKDAIDYINKHNTKDPDSLSLDICLDIFSSTDRTHTVITDYLNDIHQSKDIESFKEDYHETIEPWLCYMIYVDSPGKPLYLIGIFSHYQHAIDCILDHVIGEYDKLIVTASLHTATRHNIISSDINEYIRDINGV